jgi:type I restriction enzyme S subunit
MDKVRFYKETKFKETEIGKIPEEWEVKKVKDIFELQRGYSYRSFEISETSNTDCILLTINNFEKEGGFTQSKGFTYLLTSEKLPKNLIIHEKALFVANTDMSKGFIIGAPLLIDPAKFRENLTYSMDLTRLIPKEDTKIYLDYVFYLLQSPKIRNRIKSYGQGTNVIHLNHSLFKNLSIPLPPPEEQKAIAQRLKTIDDQIENLKEQKDHLQKIKRKFMDLLLTGKLRIKLN